MGLWRRRQWRLRVPVSIGLSAIVASGLALTSGVVAGHAESSPPALPRLGAAQVVDSADVGDPSILTVGGSFYLFGTTDWRSNVPTATSIDLHEWAAAPDAMPVLPRWAAPMISMTWAPSVVAVDGRFVMYVATEDAASGRQCIAAAIATEPAGPYTDPSGRPFLCQQDLGGSIDPSAIRDPSGKLHLVWKNDGNCCGLPTALWEQNLSADGLHLTGSAHRLLGADEAWQHGNIEAPAMLAAPRGWWLFYAGGNWRTPSYATGVAWCATMEGPCREVLDGPWLPSTSAMRTPGGLDTFRDATGHLWAAFTTTVLVPSRRHRFHVYANRVLDVAPLVSG